MYKKAEQLTTESENFELPFGAKLAADNRWVIMAKLIPCLDSLNRRETRRARIAGRK
jgi:hypothetical protein